MLRGKLKRAVGQFTPHSWENFQWGYTESLKRFLFVTAIIFFVSAGGRGKVHVVVWPGEVIMVSITYQRLK